MDEALRVGNDVNRPQLGNVSSTWMGRRFCSKTQQTENLANFNRAVEYLNNKFGDSIPGLKGRLTAQQAHYQSNRRGVNAQGGRLRTFTDNDLKKLELEALEEKNSTLHTKLKTMLDTCQCNIDQRLIIMQYGADMVKDGNKMEFAVEVCKSMAILFANKIEKFLPKEINIRSKSEAKSMREVFKPKLESIMAKNGAKYGCVASYLSSQPQSSWSPASCALKYFLLSQREDANDANKYYLGAETVRSLETKFS
jgi:hypothetical protein